MRRPQFRGFWGRAAAGIGWGFAISQAVICWLLLLVGGVIALDFGGFWMWLLLWGLPVVLFGFWFVLLWMKWERR